MRNPVLGFAASGSSLDDLIRPAERDPDRVECVHDATRQGADLKLFWVVRIRELDLGHACVVGVSNPDRILCGVDSLRVRVLAELDRVDDGITGPIRIDLGDRVRFTVGYPDETGIVHRDPVGIVLDRDPALARAGLRVKPQTSAIVPIVTQTEPSSPTAIPLGLSSTRIGPSSRLAGLGIELPDLTTAVACDPDRSVLVYCDAVRAFADRSLEVLIRRLASGVASTDRTSAPSLSVTQMSCRGRGRGQTDRVLADLHGPDHLGGAARPRPTHRHHRGDEQDAPTVTAAAPSARAARIPRRRLGCRLAPRLRYLLPLALRHHRAPSARCLGALLLRRHLDACDQPIDAVIEREVGDHDGLEIGHLL